MMEWYSVLATVVGALGGFEAVKYFLAIRANKRKENAEADKAESEADMSEFEGLRAANEWLMEQNKDLLQRTRVLSDKIQAEQEAHFKTRLDFAVKRCDRLVCGKRVPPTTYTKMNVQDAQDAEIKAKDEQEADNKN